MINPQQDLEKQIIAKAKEDAAFKQQLLSNPKTTLEQEANKKFPENVEIEVLQQTPHKLYMVLPLEIDQTQQELSEEELEAVSGGTTPACVSLVTATLVATEALNCWPF